MRRPLGPLGLSLVEGLAGLAERLAARRFPEAAQGVVRELAAVESPELRGIGALAIAVLTTTAGAASEECGAEPSEGIYGAACDEPKGHSGPHRAGRRHRAELGGAFCACSGCEYSRASSLRRA